MTTLAVLGADGFIGSAVVRAALDARLAVSAICIKEPWRLEGLDPERLRTLALPGGRWWDLGHGPCADALAEADAVALLAYTPPAANDDRLAHERDRNRDGALEVAAFSAASGTRVVFASSADVYGPWHPEPVSELVDPEPATPYAIAKLEAEQALAEISHAINLRIATVFGPGENGPRAIPSFIRALARGEAPRVQGAGDDVRDYVHVDDVARMFLAAVSVDVKVPALNVGSGTGRTTLEVAHAVAAAMGRGDVAPVHVEARPVSSRLVLDTSLAETTLGVRARTGFEDGLESEARWLSARLSL